MHFDQREQAALREVGCSTEDLERAAERVADAVRRDAGALEAFFDEHGVVYSGMAIAHSTADRPEHAVEYLDTYTHADELYGWLRFDSWGAYVVDGRVLSEDVVELTLEDRGRVRFATSRDEL
jgi:hypothetical protein